jgi:hypothetical protein
MDNGGFWGNLTGSFWGGFILGLLIMGVIALLIWWFVGTQPTDRSRALGITDPGATVSVYNDSNCDGQKDSATDSPIASRTALGSGVYQVDFQRTNEDCYVIEIEANAGVVTHAWTHTATNANDDVTYVECPDPVTGECEVDVDLLP